MLSKDQELLLEVINKIKNPEIQKEYMEKLRERAKPKPTIVNYIPKELKNFESGNEEQITVQDLKLEINQVQNLKKQCEDCLTMGQHVLN